MYGDYNRRTIIFTIFKTKIKMTQSEREWFLSLQEEMKLTLMEDMLKEGDFVMALATSKILLDAPIHKGGISTGKIIQVFDKHMDTKRQKLNKNKDE